MKAPNEARVVAVISDMHGNAAALDAVLLDLESLQPDVVVVGGDVASGPQPVETLGRAMALAGARFVSGNADREAVEAFDLGPPYGLGSEAEARDPALLTAAWVAGRLSRLHRDFLAAFEPVVKLRVAGLGDVLFCHGSPRSDVETMTSLTPPSVLRRMLSGVEEDVVVCGHTHVQFDRMVDGVRVLNAGSVGMPYQGKRGAFWLSLGPDGARLRRTEYDCERASARILAGDYWDRENLARHILLDPPEALEAEQAFEAWAAQRGER